MKLVIADIGNADMGKTTSIRNVFNILSSMYPSTTTILLPRRATAPILGKDVKATILIDNVLVGIESEGDPRSRMSKSMDDFVKMGCEIILVACHTYGETYNRVRRLARQGYEILWLPNGKSKDSACWKKLTDNYGVYVADVIQKCVKNGGLSPACL